MRTKLKSLLMVILLCIVSYTTNVSAAEEITKLVDSALINKTFYHYNIAYDKVINMPETAEKYQYLEKLTSIYSIVWTEEISKTLNMLIDLTKNSSAKTYDEIEAYVTSSKLGEWDRGYLLGELTSWGRKLVWTEDYKLAVDGLLNVNSNITEESLNNVENLINTVKNELNKEYLLEQVKMMRKKLNSSKLDPLSEILKLRDEDSLNRDKKVAKVIEIANSKNGIEIPKEYLSGIGIYIVTDHLMQCPVPTSIKDIQKEIDAVISKQELLNPIIDPVKDPVAALIKLKENQTLTEDEAITALISVAKSKTGLEIPEEYYNRAGIYHLANKIRGMKIEKGMTISDVQKNINREIAFYESSKLKFHFANVRGHIFENTSKEDINITSKLMETVGEELLPDTKIEFEKAGWQRGGPDVPVVLSEYLYVKDGQVYLRSKTIPKGGYLDNVKILVSYKNVPGSSTGLWVEIRPASAIGEKDTIGAITRKDGGFYKFDREKLPQSVRNFTAVGINGQYQPINKEMAINIINSGVSKSYYNENMGAGGSKYEYTLIVLYDDRGKALAYYTIDGYKISDIVLVE